MSDRCRCGAGKDPRHYYCWTCYAKLPYELRRDLRTRNAPAALVSKANEWLESDERKQAAKIAALKA